MRTRHAHSIPAATGRESPSPGAQLNAAIHRERSGADLERRFRHAPLAVMMALMNYDYFHQLLNARPFEPFAVHLSRGEVHPVRYPGCAVLTRTRLVITDPDADSIVVCSLLHVASVEMLQTAESTA
jgi:hypothetical protein